MMNFATFFSPQKQEASPVEALVVRRSILLIDDDPTMGIWVEQIINGISGIENPEGQRIIFDFEQISVVDSGLNGIVEKDLIFIDYHLNDGLGRTGQDLRKLILAKFPNQRTAIISSQEEGQLVLDMIKEGVRNYVVKGEDMENQLRETIQELLID